MYRLNQYLYSLNIYESNTIITVKSQNTVIPLYIIHHIYMMYNALYEYKNAERNCFHHIHHNNCRYY